MRSRRRVLALAAPLSALALTAPAVDASGPVNFVGPRAIDPAYYSGLSPRLYATPGAAVDPASESHLIVTDTHGAAGSCGANVSTDAGRTWRSSTVNMPAGFVSCAGPHSGAPQPVFSAGNPVFIAQVSSADAASTELVSMVSSDGGDTFNPAGVVATAMGQSASAQQVSLAADPSVAGRLVAVYGCGGDHSGGAATQLCVAVSGDGGKSWGSLGPTRCQLCTSATDPATYVSWPRVAVTGTGTVIVAWRGVNPLVDAQKVSVPITFRAPSPPSNPEPPPGAASCGSNCRLYTTSFPKGATSPASTTIVAPVADDPLGTPALAADLSENFAYLLWHSTGTDGSGKPIEAVWMVHSQDGGASWNSRAIRDALIPTILGDASGDAVFPAVSVAPGGRVDIAYLRMARAPQAPSMYCYQYAQSNPAAGAQCPTDAAYAYSEDAGASLNLVGVVTPHPYNSLAGVSGSLPRAVGERGVAVAASRNGGHPVWTTATGNDRDIMTDCFTYGASLCPPPQPAAAPRPPVAPITRTRPTLTLIYDHRYHLVGDLYTRLPDAPPLPPKVILRVVAPERPPLILPLAVLAISLLILGTSGFLGAQRARRLLQARRAANAASGH